MRSVKVIEITDRTGRDKTEGTTNKVRYETEITDKKREEIG